MNGSPITVHALIENTTYTSALVDSGCLCYSLITESLVRRAKLKCIPIPRKPIIGVNDQVSYVESVAKFSLDLDGYSETAYAYVVGKQEDDLILGRPWMDKNQVIITPAKKSLYLRVPRLRINSQEGRRHPMEVREVSATTFKLLMDRARGKSHQGQIKVFAASLADINKALAPKPKTDVASLVPEQWKKYMPLFDPKEASKLPPHRTGIDHAITMNQKDGKDPEAPWGPLYNMSRGELLVLRKELISLLDKGFIRASSSPAASPVLFAKKPGGGLRLCIDYRALNALTKKDRYPLPLIQETLNNVAKARWFTKLDVIAAFHKIRIREGDEWLTAFRTRFGLFEWLVTPFGMANSPSTFQRYINWTLREFLDDFCTAYLDDVLVYTDGSLKQHRKQVDQVLARLHEAGLHVDIKKCEFEVKSTKYLGFIIEAGKGLRMDPEKVRAIQEWEAPKTVKGVRSFLGFANFYRRFIRNFAQIAAPLTRLTGNVSFRWTLEEQAAFDQLKGIFVSEPVLAQFRTDRDTVMETDSSGYAIGGVLSQYDEQGVLRPCAYFSKKNTPAECNYEIHDKELLAIIRGLEEWDAELRSVKSFKVITDHKNLEYFMRPKKLNERQVRWSEMLSRYNMEIMYRPGKANVRADALSRREQDLPIGAEDIRLKERIVQVLKPTMKYYEEQFGPDDDPAIVLVGRSHAAPARQATREESAEGPSATPNEYTAEPQQSAVRDRHEIESQWEMATEEDSQYQVARKAVREENRRFPTELRLKCSISECRVNGKGLLEYRHRLWVPRGEALRTRLIELTHTSLVTGHPGREITYQMMARDYFWPGMANDVRQYVRNCDVCGRTKPWRDGLQGLLKPLPIPDRIWKEISIDFVEGLPESEGKTKLMVVTDRLSKDVVFVPLASTEVDTVVRAFIEYVVAYHWLPDAIVSDRGGQFVSHLWKRLCEILKINRRLSTAFHPQTDGATERMNSTWEAYMRAFVDWAQKDWATLCPLAQIAIRGRDATSTKVSPFFLQHGYHIDPIQLEHLSEPAREGLTERRSDEQKAETIVSRLRSVFELAQASMAEAQQEQERQANRHRKEPNQLRVGDKVWLRLDKQLSTGRESKKLDWKAAKYTVIEVIDSHSVRLNTPPGPQNVYHVDRLRLAASDPLPSQVRDDEQPLPIQVDGNEEYEVEEILSELCQRKGRGWKQWYEVKWKGYHLPTMEPRDAVESTEALDRWIHYSNSFRDADGRLPQGFRRPL
jgi:hypothetical protein